MNIKSLSVFVFLFVFISCDKKNNQTAAAITVEQIKDNFATPVLNLKQANNLSQLPLHCIDKEYPNKMGHVTASPEDQKRPKETHPVFYGCFDWHSAVHGYWSSITLIKQFPQLATRDELLNKINNDLTVANIQTEIDYLNTTHNKTFERTYGWAWLLKLQEELDTWDDPAGKKLSANLRPLSDLIVSRYLEYLPKLNYAIRVGEHSNTAFGMVFIWDYAVHSKNVDLQDSISTKALEFYQKDEDCPLSWEPSGYDFLSPCLEEIDIMRRILKEEDFHKWLSSFLPGIENGQLALEVGKVSDRTDGKLVHIDGLNLSRAWVLYGLAKQYPRYESLIDIADEHVQYTLPNLVADDYEGGHWLGSFAIYALQQASND